MIVETLMAFIGTISFSILFDVPKRHYFFCGLTGAVGWITYRLTINIGISNTIATFLATVVLTSLSRALSTFRKTPTTIFLISGIFCLVPGALVYYSAYYTFMSEPSQAFFYAKETVKIALSISLGIIFVYSISPKFFGWNKSKVNNIVKN